MQINLRQPEIIEALKQYIGGQGINLHGKKVDVEFTAGRKNSGLSAEISIEDDLELPNLTPDLSQEKPALTVVQNTEVLSPPMKTEPSDDAPSAKTTSLFS